MIVAVFLVAHCSSAEARTRVEAYVGQPFGVAQVTVDVPRGQPIAPLGDDRFAVAEEQGRALYPVLQTAPVRRLLRQVLEIESPRQTTIYFLFQGDQPLDLTVYAPTGQQVRVIPEYRPRRHRQLMDIWWREYTRRYQDVARSGEYPLVVQNYLTATLSRRLGLPMPRQRTGLFQREDVDLALGVMFGTESIRAAMQKDVLLGDVRRDAGGEIANLPLPSPINPPAVDYGPVPADVDVEPIAMHVPHECFYVRFGTFTNYLWLRDLTKQFNGDLANMVAVRSIDHGANGHIEQQLALKESALAKVLGPTVIRDVAIIGTDTFVREGAAVGILFHARNNFGLGSDIRRQRAAARSAHANAMDETITIAGKKVSYLSTPLGEIRSYYVQDGDFHFVTTSRYLVRRFLEAGSGQDALGASNEFRHARVVMPTDRNDTVFAYFSDAFIRHLVSPAYRVEMTRRMRSLVEIEAAKIAPLAAAAEGRGDASLDALTQQGFLPRGFGRHADGSELIVQEGRLVDSVRGVPGFLLPIPDVGVEAVTSQEAADYAEFAQVYRGDWQRVDPIIAAIGRQPMGQEGLERLTVQLLITPFHEQTYGGLARYLGPPVYTRLLPVVGDVASLQAFVRLSGLFGGGNRTHHIFGGLRDFKSPMVARRGKVDFGPAPQQVIRGYLGSAPRLGILDWFLPVDPHAVDEHGYAPPAAGADAWRRTIGDMAIFSFKQDVLARVTPQLAFGEAERPAQIRLRIEDLSDKAVSEMVNAFGYQRARQASASATRFMNSLHQQLHVPREESRGVAEMLIDGTFVDPLGGTYELVAVPGGLPTWISTAMTEQNRWMLIELPEDYIFPLLTWFRGVSAELSLVDETLSAHVELDMQLATEQQPGGLQLPSLQFNFGGDATEEPQSGEEPPPPLPPAEELPPPKPDK